MPWQDRPEGSGNLPVWRYNENPIIGRNPAKGVARIFNSAVMPYKDSFIGVFRGEQTNGIPYIYLGRSKDAIHWEFEEDKIPFKDENGNDFSALCIMDRCTWECNIRYKSTLFIPLFRCQKECTAAIFHH